MSQQSLEDQVETLVDQCLDRIFRKYMEQLVRDNFEVPIYQHIAREVESTVQTYMENNIEVVPAVKVKWKER